MSGRLRFRHVVSALAALSLIGVWSVAVCVAPAVAQDTSTTTSVPTSSSIVLGNSNTDSATVSGSDVPDPTGTVSFYACGPDASSCTPSGSPFDTENLSGSSDPDTVTTVNSFTPTAAGTWCFAAVYSGDSNYGVSSDESSDECFAVTQATSTTSTSPVEASILLGGSDTDSATVTGSVSGVDPTGTVSFYECGPDSSPVGCTTGTQFDTETLSGTSDPGTVTSASFTPDATGTWCFGAVYSGDPNYSTSSDESTDECFTVTVASSSTTTTPTSSTIVLGATDTDSATVTGSISGTDPTGSVSFYACGPDSSAQSCTPSGSPFSTVPLGGVSNPDTVTSGAFTPTGSGHWCFAALYSGDSNYATSSDTLTAECFTVTVATPTLTSAPSGSQIAVGSSDTDYVTVAGNTAGGAPTGTLLFYECGPTTTPVACTSKLNKVGTGAVTLTPGANDQSTAHSAALTVAQGNPGYFCFGVYYSGSTEYATGSDTSTTECFDAISQPEITSFTPTSGKSGATVTIKGSYLAHATVTIGKVTQTLTLDKAGEIKFTVAKTTKTGFITVTTVGGSSTTTQKFKVT
jgi:hypothetical protein